MAEKIKWFRIPLQESELPKQGTVMEVKVAKKMICLGRLKEGLFALDNKCPHASGKLGQGWCDENGNVVCPHHRYTFDPRTGKNTSGEGFFCRPYPIKKIDDSYYIGFPEKKLWSFFNMG